MTFEKMTATKVEYTVTVTVRLLFLLKTYRVLRLLAQPVGVIITGVALFAAVVAWKWYAVVAVAGYGALLLLLSLLISMLSMHRSRVIGGPKPIIQTQVFTPENVKISIPGRVELTIPRTQVKDITYFKHALCFRYVRYITCMPLPADNREKIVARLKDIGWV
jgi:hypothetical protein